MRWTDAARYHVEYNAAPHRATRYHTTLHHNATHHSTTHCFPSHRSRPQHTTLHHSSTHNSIAQHSATEHSTAPSGAHWHLQIHKITQSRNYGGEPDILTRGVWIEAEAVHALCTLVTHAFASQLMFIAPRLLATLTHVARPRSSATPRVHNLPPSKTIRGASPKS